MSYGQAPFDTNYSANTARLINVADTLGLNEENLITFIRGVAGNGKTLYVDTDLTYNPSDSRLTALILSSTDAETDTILVRDTGGMFYTIDMKMTNLAGRLIFEPTNITIFPYDAGQVVIDGLGGLTVAGGSSGITMADRSTGDFFTQYSDAGVFTILSNGLFGQINFELSKDGLASLKGLSAGLRFYERQASPTNYYSLFTSATGSVFTLTYNGTSIATIGTTGITTLVPQRIQTTAQTTGTFYLNLVPLSTTQTAGQVVSVHSGLSYNVATSTLTATTFSGAFSGTATNATNIGITTTGISSSFNVVFVGNSGSFRAGTISSSGNLTFNPSTGGLTATTFFGNLSGTTGSVSGTFTATTFNGSLSGPASLIATTQQTAGTFPVALLTIATTYPAGQVVNVSSGLTYNAGTNTLTTTTFSGSLTGSASLIDTTQQTTGTYYLTLAPLTTTQSAGQTLYTGIVSYQYLSWTNGVMSNRGSYRMVDRSNGTSFFWDIFTTTGNALTFDYNSGSRQITISTAGVLGGGLVGISRLTNPLYIGNVDGYTGGGNVPLAMLLNTLGDGFYNNIQLGHSSAINKSWFIGARNNTTAGDTIFSLAPYGTAQTGCWYVNPLGQTTQAGALNAPDVNTTYLTINQGNIIIYDQVDGTKYWTISSSASGQLYFNNTTSSLAIPFSINYDGNGITAYNIQALGYAPTIANTLELDTPILTDGNNGNGIAYVPTTAGDYASQATKTTPTSVASGALITMSVQACNPNNKYFEVSFPLNAFNNFTRTSGTFAIDVNLTALTVSMTRNGSNFTNFAYDKPTLPTVFRYTMTAGTNFTNIQQPFFMLDIFFCPTDVATSGGIPSIDEYIIKIVPTFTTTTITGVGTRTGLNGGSGFDIDIGTVHSTAPANFTFNTADPTCSALAITKSQSPANPTVSPYYLNAQFLNLAYSRTFTSTVSAYEPLCFIGGYTYYDITLNLTSAPTAYTAVSFGLADNIGTYLLTGYNGLTALLGSAYSTVAWTNSAFIAYVPAQTYHPLKWTISNPNSARRKMITGTNNGSASAVIDDIPFVASGQNTTTTAYNSCWWSVVGTAVNGSITICGRNA